MDIFCRKMEQLVLLHQLLDEISNPITVRFSIRWRFGKKKDLISNVAQMCTKAVGLVSVILRKNVQRNSIHGTGAKRMTFFYPVAAAS